MINPSLVSIDDKTVSYEEGCLSFPEHFADIDRPDQLTIKYLDDNTLGAALESRKNLG